MNTILASEKAFSLAELLEHEGFHAMAEEIRVAIYGGATGLEIAFRLRDKLNWAIKNEKIPRKFFEKADEIQKYLK